MCSGAELGEVGSMPYAGAVYRTKCSRTAKMCPKTGHMMCPKTGHTILKKVPKQGKKGIALQHAFTHPRVGHSLPGVSRVRLPRPCLTRGRRSTGGGLGAWEALARWLAQARAQGLLYTGAMLRWRE